MSDIAIDMIKLATIIVYEYYAPVGKALSFTVLKDIEQIAEIWTKRLTMPSTLGGEYSRGAGPCVQYNIRYFSLAEKTGSNCT